MTATAQKTRKQTASVKNRKSWWQRQKQNDGHAEVELACTLGNVARVLTYPNLVRKLYWQRDLAERKHDRAERHLAKIKGLVEHYRETRANRLQLELLVSVLQKMQQAQVDKVDIGWLLGELYSLLRVEKQDAPRHAFAKCVCGSHLTKATSEELDRWNEIHEDCVAQ